MSTPCRIVFVFLDGVGIGEPTPERNPFFSAELPTLHGLLGERLPSLESAEITGRSAVAFPLDTTLGVGGIPQSGTGQTTLLTGENAAAFLGGHFGPWTPTRLRPLLAEKNILTRAREAGRTVEFANAYPAGFRDSRWARRPAAPPLAAEAADLLTRNEEALKRGDALASGIVNTDWRTHLEMSHLPEITPEEAGENLARISSGADLTFFAHYSTDYAGHKQDLDAGVRALEKVDGFLGGILESMEADTLLVVCSDHGNLEDVTTGHTTNPAFTLFAGPDAAELRGDMKSIAHLAGVVLGVLGIAKGRVSGPSGG